jgi:hypothetical protein
MIAEPLDVQVTAGVTDLTTPDVRLGRIRAGVGGSLLGGLHRAACSRRLAELKFAAGDPHPMHNHPQFAGDGDGARFIPRRFATAIPQARKRDHLRVRIISTVAAS